MVVGIATALLFAHPAEADPVKLSDAQAAVLQTDGPRAIGLFRQFQPLSTSPWDTRRARCSVARLTGKPSIPSAAVSGDPLSDRIIGIYRSYWQRAMVLADRNSAEEKLFNGLRNAIRRPDLKDREAVLTEVSVQLNARNIYTSSQGKTATLYDLLLYLQEEEKPYKVDLADGTTFDVKVTLMRSMISSGWSRYFNCGGPGTGGFATSDGLFAIAETYDLDGEDFLGSFLTHETRHFADYKRYPDLEGPELEYRAKLSELAVVDKTQKEVVELFEGNQGDDRAIPHSYANKRVLIALRDRLGLAAGASLLQTDRVRLREAARALLIEDNQRRDKAQR